MAQEEGATEGRKKERKKGRKEGREKGRKEGNTRLEGSLLSLFLEIGYSFYSSTSNSNRVPHANSKS